MEKPRCKCGHEYAEHAPDLSHPLTAPCWHGAATGEGCMPTYNERCKNYEAA
jgi:hypothetical protein